MINAFTNRITTLTSTMVMAVTGCVSTVEDGPVQHAPQDAKPVIIGDEAECLPYMTLRGRDMAAFGYPVYEGEDR